MLVHNTDEKFPYQDILGQRFALTWALISGLAVKGSRSFLHSGHVFYLDRYYTSMELLYQLAQNNTYAVG